ncbi:MAG: hypothetical protein BWK78_05695 [Thiotrichaceae bacterium IS1]|nr:MAG: hypothetical protein BWK78_05695 [Thiotrichaceae bacterium IS1]
MYAFQLRTDLATEVVEDAARLWEKCMQLGNSLAIPELQQLPSKLLCYQAGRYTPEAEQGQPTHFLKLIQPEGSLRFSSLEQPNNLTRIGSIGAFRLHDVYAIDLTLQYSKQVMAVSQLNCLNPQGCLLPQAIQASVGQTLVLYVEPTEETTPDQALADECVKALWQDTAFSPPTLVSQSQFLGCPIFEYETIPSPAAVHSNELQHLLIWFGKDQKQYELSFGKASRSLIYLLCCRHKIHFAYYQADQINRAARVLYNQLESQSNDTFGQSHSQKQRLTGLKKLLKAICSLCNQLKGQSNDTFGQPLSQKQRLAGLEKLLDTMPHQAFQYTRHLRDLNDQLSTIRSNLRNFSRWSQQWRSLKEANDDLAFWEEFQHTGEQFDEQIQVYLNYLKPGQNLFQQMVDTAQGLVEVDSLKHSHRLELIVVLVASMLEGTAISAKVNHHLTEVFWQPTHAEGLGVLHGSLFHWQEIVLHFLVVGLPLGMLAWLIVLLLQKK